MVNLVNCDAVFEPLHIESNNIYEFVLVLNDMRTTKCEMAYCYNIQNNIRLKIDKLNHVPLSDFACILIEANVHGL